MRPRYYYYGGYLVLINAPANGPQVIDGQVINNIDIRAVIGHPTVSDVNDELLYPEHFESMLMWGVVHLARMSDEDSTSQKRAEAFDMRGEKIKDNRIWVAQYGAAGSQGPRVETGRGRWRGRSGRQRGPGYPA